ncbi:methanogenesis marker 8 protein [Candidatus Borrarchaeum sp.]|uniref:methanogenesis marker 8 protein n=1 Tax=Candidatus Borrarchaeum sp. TaxID=2846742 RepID=UPI00257E0F55|nr:methanogenesis marker 8 protein [Candidatus Borrarchaeum sp.]
MSEDEHIIEVAKARVVIKNGKVIDVGKPLVTHCPLRHEFYGGVKETPESIRDSVEMKIEEFGFFTKNRVLEYEGRDVPFGASEMLRDAMHNGLIDITVCACDGAGTVLVKSPELVQGIGARMTGLVKTSPIPETINQLKNKGGIVLNPKTAVIDQVEGVKRAFSLANKVAVTLAGIDAEKIPLLKKYEKQLDVKLTILAVHTTGISPNQASVLAKGCDLIWGCASKALREIIGPNALLQIGVGIPVFALTEQGKKIIANRIVRIDSQLLVTRARLPKLVEHKQPDPLL